MTLCVCVCVPTCVPACVRASQRDANLPTSSLIAFHDVSSPVIAHFLRSLDILGQKRKVDFVSLVEFSG